MEQKDIIDPFKPEEPSEDKKGPSKKDLWIVLVVVLLFLAVMLIQRR